MSKLSFRGKILESKSAWLHFDETDIFQAGDILALVLSSALEGAKESWLSLCTPGWAEPRRLRAGRGHLSKSPRKQAQDTGSCHRKLQRNYTHRGAFQPHQVQLCRKLEAPQHRRTCLKSRALASKEARGNQGYNCKEAMTGVFCCSEQENLHVKNCSSVQSCLLSTQWLPGV